MQNTLLEDIAIQIGFSATVKITAIYGGGFIRIPKKCSKSHPLVKLIGESAFKKLQELYPDGDAIHVPNLSEFERLRNIKTASKLAIRGVSSTEIAALIKSTPRNVYNWLKLAEEIGLIQNTVTHENHQHEDIKNDSGDPGKQGGKRVRQPAKNN